MSAGTEALLRSTAEQAESILPYLCVIVPAVMGATALFFGGKTKESAVINGFREEVPHDSPIYKAEREAAAKNK